MDALLILLLGGLVACALRMLPARRGGRPPASRRTGSPTGSRSPSESSGSHEALEAEDLAQMLALHNARRRDRGEPERTAGDIERLIASDLHEQRRRRADDPVGSELGRLPVATGARRRARGLAQRTRDEVESELGR